ncbi:MAG TPA: efflux RND transporter periplasmic adaptor subunit [Aestuariivirgaceae bacterium]|jgi:membrane fusion protein, multidrug efflux system|nr:efflux RND transporter periplasmic adaptor subunit [Aestuariivirgaceae bacterium]
MAVLLAGILLAGGGGYYAWQHWPVLTASQNAARAGAAPPPPVPVTLATVEKAAFPVYQNGLGTVQAFNTVLVRTRVDGQIEKIAFKEGQMVQAGDLLVQIDARPFQAALDQANAKKAQDEATLANTKADLQRFISLGKFATRQQIDTQQTTVNQNTAQLALDQAAIDNAATQLSYTIIRAPITGLTGFRQVDIGNIVNAAAQTGIVTITQIEPISVIFTAPEEQLQDINRALAAGPLPVIALSTDGRRKLSEGTLTVVNNQVDAATGTVRLKATFANQDHALWPGLSVATRMLVRTLSDAVVIPDDAVQHGPDGLYVYVVEAGKALRQDIVLSQSADGRSVVSKGLSAGQQVIKEGQYRVQPGTMVATPEQAATNQPEKVD